MVGVPQVRESIERASEQGSSAAACAPVPALTPLMMNCDWDVKAK